MKHATRLAAAALGLLAGLAVLAVSVETQERTRGSLRLAATDVREMRAADRALVQMERGGELKLREKEPDTMIAGRQHERLDQYYQGVPVFGADLVRQTDGQVTLSVFGTLERGIDLETTPSLGPETAIAVFERETGHKVSPSRAPKLFVLPKDDGTYALTWRVSQYTKLAAPVLFVNAMNGRVELQYDNLHRQTPAIGRGTGVLGDEKKVSASLRSGVYVANDEMRPPQLVTLDLRGNIYRADAILSGWSALYWSDVASDTDNEWRDGAVVDAHSYAGWAYDYFFKRFGRKGLDDRNAPIRVMVHPLSRGDTGPYSGYNFNAFWCPACGDDERGYAFFGDGHAAGRYDSAGQHWNYVAGGIDCVAHELTHAVTGYASGLIYRNESGALDEAFSDAMSTGIEFFYQSAGQGSMKADYLIAEDVVTAADAGARTGIRSLADPRLFRDPDHYSIRERGSEDNGGVHANGLIPGHAFYLAIEGGTNRTSGRRVEGVGAANREQIEKVFYRAFVYFLTSYATFHSARLATIRAAQELYGDGSAARRAVTQAWDAVGVF